MRSTFSALLPFVVVLGVLGTGLTGCTRAPETRFERLPAHRTSIDFNNAIVEDDSLLNPLDFEYIYNGGGVAVGDFNDDGRPDLYFTGNVVDNRLYLNQGDFRFADVTEAAGVAAPDAWSTGIALVDINQDGLLDLYVCVGGPPKLGGRRANRLYVNQGVDAEGVPSFEEQAADYGIADPGYSTQAAFFDYDRDGDLDLYVLTTEMQKVNRNALRPKQTRGEAPNTDRLYRNDTGSPNRSRGQARSGTGGDGTFTDVSGEAGIRIEGYGLGLAVSDVNKDGWPDIYVANDFISNDLLYLNNRDGTFTNRIASSLKHQSYSAMGVDVADFNNDARPDIVVLDMRPPDNNRQKLMTQFFSYDTFHTSLRLGHEPQYVRNTLQLNNGMRPNGTPVFSEIGQLAGVQATDWSWAPLFADFDNDGHRDLFVTNGYGEDVTNLDFAAHRQEALAFGTDDMQQKEIREAMKDLPEVKLSNFFFKNDGAPGSPPGQALTFTDKTDAWAPSRPGLSNGAAFADLDRDGDLDLVTNNINDEATVLKNHTRERDSTHFLRVKLHGPDGNRAGIGAKVTLSDDGTTQYHDHSPYRGYQSTVEPTVHFGMGADSTADSLAVVWPDGQYQTFTNVTADRVLAVQYDEAVPRDTAGDRAHPLDSTPPERASLFQEAADERGLTHRHDEYTVDDFEETPTLPHTYSQNGPGLAVGDVDGNGLDDVFVGADRNHERSLFLQTAPGRFTERPLPMDTRHEDMGALFFDADGNGHLDLYVVSGSNVAPANSEAYQDRLYLGDGDGTFRRAPEALPTLTASGSSVTAADYDGDGDLDLFVGGRVVPGSYPLPPRSYLLRNDTGSGSGTGQDDGRVRFTDVTDEIAPGLAEVGLVTSALWTDVDGDDQIDLLLAGEWMPITLFKNEGGRFEDATGAAGLNGTSGWWNSLAAGDFDRDGDMDYVAGNLGRNTRYRASPNEPVRVHAKDFDGNGRLDPVLSHYIQGTRYPVAGRKKLIDQIPAMQRRFPTYADYAEAPFDAVFTEEEREDAYVAEAVRFATSYLENQGDGTFAVRSLPTQTQIAPIFGMQAGDYDGDGHLDLLMVGNWYAPDLKTGRADAFIGGFLRGDGTGRFAFVDGVESGFFVNGDAKGLAAVATGNGSSLMVATQNSGRLQAFSTTSRSGTHVRLRPLDRYALLTFEDGLTRKEEFFYGSTYLSQSSRVLHLPENLQAAVIYDARGNRRAVRVDSAALAGSGE